MPITSEEIVRCHWASNEWNTAYHDEEWGRPVTDERGRLRGYSNITRDLTERKRMEEEQRRIARKRYTGPTLRRAGKRPAVAWG